MVLVDFLSSWLIAGPVQVMSMKHQLEQSILHCQRTSAGVQLLYVAANRLMYTSFPLLTHSFNCLHSFPVLYQWALFAPFIVRCRGFGIQLLLLLSQALLIPQCKDSTSTCWIAERHISCLSCLQHETQWQGSLLEVTARVTAVKCSSTAVRKWHKTAGICHKIQLPSLTCPHYYSNNFPIYSNNDSSLCWQSCWGCSSYSKYSNKLQLEPDQCNQTVGINLSQIYWLWLTCRPIINKKLQHRNAKEKAVTC